MAIDYTALGRQVLRTHTQVRLNKTDVIDLYDAIVNVVLPRYKGLILSLGGSMEYRKLQLVANSSLRQIVWNDERGTYEWVKLHEGEIEYKNFLCAETNAGAVNVVIDTPDTLVSYKADFCDLLSHGNFFERMSVEMFGVLELCYEIAKSDTLEFSDIHRLYLASPTFTDCHALIVRGELEEYLDEHCSVISSLQAARIHSTMAYYHAKLAKI